MDLLWYEKYRAKKISSLALPKEYSKAFENYIKKKQIPHILLNGQPGSGKTTIAQILIDEIAANSLSLNASSDDRGINTIKTTVKQFARSKPRIKGKPNIIFFDEADGLTYDAQRALNNTIEANVKTCRFIFTCNYIDKIEPAIISRCQVFNLETLPIKDLNILCFEILKKEKVKFQKEDVKKVIERYYPDIRSVINNLESCSISGKFKENFLDRIDVNLFPQYILKGKLFALRNMWVNTRDFTILYRYLFNDFIINQIKDKQQKQEGLIIVAEYLFKDKTIADREINFTACILEIMSLIGVKKIDFNSEK